MRTFFQRARATVCGVFALLVIGLAACQSIPQTDTPIRDGVIYAVLDLSDQPEDTDYSQLTLDLVDFSPGADWVGGSYATVTLPVAEEVRADGRTISRDTPQDLLSFLSRPSLESCAPPGATDVLRAEVLDGTITAMDWFAGETLVGGVLWQDADYRQFLPYALRLPESWRNKFDTISSLSRNGQGIITSYQVEFLRRDDQSPLCTLHYQMESDFEAQYGMEEPSLDDQGILMLDRKYDWYVYLELPQAAAEDVLLEDLLAQKGEDLFAWLEPNTYASGQYGFTLSFPDSWQNHFYAEETLRGTKFFFQPGDVPLCSLEVSAEPLSQEELDSRGAQPAGSGNGWYVYFSIPASLPADGFDDSASELRWRRMYQDLLLEIGSWDLTFAQGDDAIYPAPSIPVEPGVETRAAFAQVLRNLTESHVLPDGTQLTPGVAPADFSGNRFAIADVDYDGKEELILCYVTADTAGQQGTILGYAPDRGEVYIQLLSIPGMEFYGNGAVKVRLSHNQVGSALWPYILYTYQPQADLYRPEAFVYSWEKGIHPTNDTGEPFPDQLDRSKTGILYYVESGGWDDSTPLDQADYLTWEKAVLEDSPQRSLSFLPLTEENIAALEG